MRTVETKTKKVLENGYYSFFFSTGIKLKKTKQTDALSTGKFVVIRPICGEGNSI